MKRVLIVEDDVDIHNFIKDVLKKEKYNVISAYSGTEVLPLIENIRNITNTEYIESIWGMGFKLYE